MRMRRVGHIQQILVAFVLVKGHVSLVAILASSALREVLAGQSQLAMFVKLVLDVRVMDVHCAAHQILEPLIESGNKDL